jgi:hypothetical protein
MNFDFFENVLRDPKNFKTITQKIFYFSHQSQLFLDENTYAA